MVTYQYKAVGPDGKPMRGIVRAQDEMTAVRKIRETCPIITSIEAVKENNRESILSKEITFRKRINEHALAILCSQLEIMLRTGMPVARSLEIVSEQVQRKQIARALHEVAEDVSEGSSVASAFERNGRDYFPMTFVETIRAGEESGHLEDSFRRMHQYYDKFAKNKDKLKRALTYPIFVVAVAVVVLIIVMAKVIPTLAKVFDSMQGELPLITRMMIGMSDFFAKWWILIILILAAVVFCVCLYFQTENGALVRGKIALRLPVLGELNTAASAAQFSDTMAVMLASGLTLNRAVEVTASVLGNQLLREKVHEIGGKIEAGRSLKDCIKQISEFPDALRQMVGIGEETGELDETFLVIGEYFDNEADHLTKQALNKLEPTILIILAIFTAFIVISIYLPMFTMYNLF
jgi:type IV pilus assembly protein PilC